LCNGHNGSKKQTAHAVLVASRYFCCAPHLALALRQVNRAHSHIVPHQYVLAQLAQQCTHAAQELLLLWLGSAAAASIGIDRWAVHLDAHKVGGGAEHLKGYRVLDLFKD